MNDIINFLEQYWGYTIFGGVTLGAVITNIIVTIKIILTNKIKNKQSTEVINSANALQGIIDKQREDYEKLLQDAQKEQTRLNTKLIEDNQKFQQLQAIIFTALSYIIMGSKLDNETKLSVLNKMNSLLENQKPNMTIEEVKTHLEKAMANYIDDKTSVTPEQPSSLKEQVEEATHIAHTLFDKYTNNSGV